MAKTVDSYRYLSGVSKRMVKEWIKMETPREIPWTPMPKPLSRCRVALLSSAGLALKTDVPFDQEGERENPWWGDPSYRVLPSTTTEAEIYHLHVDPTFVRQDLNCLLPIARLNELADTGEIGSAAARHYSIMGYILRPDTLLSETVPAMVDKLQEDQVDVVVLVPA